MDKVPQLSKFNIDVGSFLLFIVFSTFFSYGAGLLALLTYNIMASQGLDDYDIPIERYRKIRRDYIQQFRSGKLTKEQKIEIENDIKVMDAVIERTDGHDEWYLNSAAFFQPSHRHARHKLKTEQVAEELFNNDLFLKAESIRNRA